MRKEEGKHMQVRARSVARSAAISAAGGAALDIVLACAMIVLLVLAARAAEPGQSPGMMVHGMPGMTGTGMTTLPADGAALWTYTTEVDPYTGWAFWPGYDTFMPGTSPHGAWVKYYVNSIAMKAARSGVELMPAGAIMVKENYDKDKKTLVAITSMYKVQGYNPSGGDWFWAMYAADGKPLGEGKIASCMGCHANAKNTDWRFVKYTGPVPEKKATSTNY
jgi:hypothetical protein